MKVFYFFWSGFSLLSGNGFNYGVANAGKSEKER